jgi:hypothetical protein
MVPLYDRAGSVAGWLGDGGRIIDRSGRSSYWIIRDGYIYDYHGRHRGWWANGHWRGRDGGVVVWTRGATNLGVLPPLPQLPPSPPLPELEPLRPPPSLPPLRPLNAMSWSRDTFD